MKAINSGSSQIVLDVRQDDIHPVHWGLRLENLETLLPWDSYALREGGLDKQIAPSLFRFSGNQNYLSPNIELAAGGRILSRGKAELSHLEAEKDFGILYKGQGFEIEYFVDTPSANLFRIRQIIRNIDLPALSVRKFLYSLHLPQHITGLMSFSGRWNREWQPQLHDLDSAIHIVNRTNRVSQRHVPGWVFSEAGFSDDHNQLWAVNLAVAGNHEIIVEADDFGLCIGVGEFLEAGEVELVAGEYYSAPDLLLSHAANGLNGIRRSFHHYLRSVSKKTNRPVQLNSWEAFYFDQNESKVLELIESAEKLGVERFVLDDGWFRDRNSDRSGLGNWEIDLDKYPGGFSGIADGLRSNTIEFGLWIEPEMLNADAEILKEHPDWMLRVSDDDQIPARNQWSLNLLIPEALDWVIEQIKAILSKYNVQSIKWDMNRDISNPFLNGHVVSHRYQQAVLELLHNIRSEFPDLEIEFCASGGGRMSYAFVPPVSRFWLSDNMDSFERIYMQRWASVFYPPEFLGAHVASRKSKGSGRVLSYDFQAAIALAFHFGFELDIRDLDEGASRKLKDYVEFFKEHRNFMHDQDLTYLDTPSEIQCWSIGNSKLRFLWIAQIEMAGIQPLASLKIPGLKPASNYKITVCLESLNPLHQKKLPNWCTSDQLLGGEQLMSRGLPFFELEVGSCALLQIETAQTK